MAKPSEPAAASQSGAFSKTSHGAGLDSMEIDSDLDEPSVGETSGQMKKALAGFVAARVELASIEAKEAAQFAVKKAIFGGILAVSVFLVWLLTLAGLTGFLAPLADEWLKGKTDQLPGWVAVLFALAVLHLIVALICVLVLKRKPAAPFFELSRQEIENDKQWLKENK